MGKVSLKSAGRSAGQIAYNLGIIIIGCMLCAVAINGILIPHGFVSGGIMGLALVIHYLVSSVPVGWLYLLLNIPLFALGWMFVGRRFLLYSITATCILSLALLWTHIAIPIHDNVLSAILAGIFSGAGVGIILKSPGSSGGLDILSVMLLRRFSIRLGTTILAFNVVILVAAAAILSLDKALYTLIYLYVSSSMINLVVTGLSQRKAVHIISPRWEEISREIREKLQRGVTIIEGRGGYTGREEHILYTVITFQELARLKRLVHSIDPAAFVVINDTLEVMGHRIGNQPHW